MKTAYQYLAWLIALDVLFQAASIAYANYGLERWLDDGHPLTKDTMNDAHFAGIGGFAFHGLNGLLVMGVLSIALLVVSFLSQVPVAPKAASLLFAMVLVQIVLGMASHAVPILGVAHGMLALGVFGYAAMIGWRTVRADTPAAAVAVR